MKKSLVVSLIGRPNVGKSTIFNRILRRPGHRAITHDKPGVTRDRHYAIASIDDRADLDPQDIIVVDTGGFYPERIEETQEIDPFFNLMANQAKLAIHESDLVLFVVDVREGLLPFDQLIADYLRTTGKPYWVLVNKYDTEKQEGDQYQFLGLTSKDEDLMVLSAEHARGLIELRERIQLMSIEFSQELDNDEFLQKGVKPNHEVVANLAIIGAPNVGKSTLLNKLVGASRALVSPIAGTTVDPIEAYIDLFFGDDSKELVNTSRWRRSNSGLMEEYIQLEDQLTSEPSEQVEMLEEQNDAWEQPLFDQEDLEDAVWGEDDLKDLMEREESIEEEILASQEAIVEIDPYRSVKIVDTAGIRRAKSIESYIEEQSVYRSLRSISESDIVIFMVDATKGISHQDRRLMDISLEKGKSLIICLNKVDLLQAKYNDAKKRKEWLENLKVNIPWLSFCQMVTISAKRGTNISALKKAIKDTILVRCQKISTSSINKVLNDLVHRNQVSLVGSKGVTFKVKYAAMVRNSPPTFIMFTNKSKDVPDNFRKYLQSGIRKEFKMINTPIHLIFRTTADMEKRLKKMGVATK